MILIVVVRMDPRACRPEDSPVTLAGHIIQKTHYVNAPMTER